MSFFDDLASFEQGVADAAGDVVGFDTKQDRDRRRAQQSREDAQAEAQRRVWEQLGGQVPEVTSWSPDVTPYLAEHPEAAGAQADAGSIEAQRRAMAQLGETYGGYHDIYSHGGLTDADRARIQQSQMEQKRFERGQSEAAMQQAAARGMLGGGGELLARTQAQQEGANRANEQGLGIEALAEQRAMAALGGMGATSGAQGSLASGMRGQSFEEEYRRRRAQDERAQFNNGIFDRNVDRQYQAHRDYVGDRQQQFGNRASVAAGQTGQYSDAANREAQRSAQEEARRAAATQRNQGIVSGIIGAIAGRDDEE